MRSIRAAKKVTVRRFATAAVVAASLSTPAAAQGTGGTMPANCEQNLNQCSLKIWAHNSFPRAGFQQSTTFSNGMTLTCTSNGADKPRTCTLKDSRAANGSGDGDQGVASPGTDKNVVLRVQSRLREERVYAGPIDGALTSTTEDAIRRYQLKVGLPVTGDLDERTLMKLGLVH